MYDITVQVTFNNVKNWLWGADRYAGGNVIKVLIGNKCDLEEEREVSYEEGHKFAEDNGFAGFIECSAKADKNVEEVFLIAARKYLERYRAEKEEMKEKMNRLN